MRMWTSMRRWIGFFVLIPLAILLVAIYALGVNQESKCPNGRPAEQENSAISHPKESIDGITSYYLIGAFRNHRNPKYAQYKSYYSDPEWHAKNTNVPFFITIYCSIFASKGTLALAVWVYSIFAILQWRAIQRQASIAETSARTAERNAAAAERYAKAFVNTERPWLAVRPISLGDFRKVCESVDFPVGEPISVRPVVRMEFVNYGRSPALLVEYCVEFSVFRGLPPGPSYTHIVKIEDLTVSGDSFTAFIRPDIGRADSTFFQEFVSPDAIDRKQISDIRRNKVQLWVYGFFKYTDNAGDPHEWAFCAAWRAQMRPRDDTEFAFFAPKGYWRNT